MFARDFLPTQPSEGGAYLRLPAGRRPAAGSSDATSSHTAALLGGSTGPGRAGLGAAAGKGSRVDGFTVARPGKGDAGASEVPDLLEAHAGASDTPRRALIGREGLPTWFAGKGAAGGGLAATAQAREAVQPPLVPGSGAVVVEMVPKSAQAGPPPVAWQAPTPWQQPRPPHQQQLDGAEGMALMGRPAPRAGPVEWQPAPIRGGPSGTGKGGAAGVGAAEGEDVEVFPKQAASGAAGAAGQRLPLSR